MTIARIMTAKRLVAAALSATVAAAGLGLAVPAALADEPAAPAPASADPVAGAPIAASALTCEQAAADPAYENAGANVVGIAVCVNLTNQATEAGKLYDAIDALRAESGLEALVRDASLEAEAYQRGAEASLLLANVRPNGTLFSTVDPAGRATAEIVISAPADTAATPQDVLSALSDEQRALLASASTNIGVAQLVDAQGNTYWAIELSADGLSGEGSAVPDGAATYRVSVSSANVTVGSASSALALEAGVPQSIVIPSTVAGTISNGAGVSTFADVSVTLDASALTWNSSDPAVATVDASGTATGVGSGTCTLSATGAAGQFIFDTTVTGGEPAASIVDLADCTVAGILGSYEATGEPVAPAFSVIDANSSAVDANQYTYAFTDNVEPGTATLTITAAEGSRIVTGSISKTFEIVAPAPAQVAVPNVLNSGYEDAAAALEAAGLVPTATEGEPAPDDASTGLVYATDPAPEGLVDTGTAVSIFYHRAPDAPVATDLAAAGATATVAPAYYADGAPVEPAVTVTLPDGTVLNAGTDYTVSYANNIEKTSAENPALATVSGIGAYTGAFEVQFQIVDRPASVTNLKNAGYTIAEIAPQVYAGAPVAPTVVLNGPTALDPAVDYTVSYENNGGPGTARVTVTGQGAYEGTITADFLIQGDLSQACVTGLDGQTFTGGEIKPAPTVTVGETVLTAGTDYDISYANNVNVGTATVTITDKGSYTGTTTATFTIAAKSIKSFKVNPIASVDYTGAAQTPAVTVTDGTTVLGSADCTVAYEQNVNAGTAHVVITGTGNYCDSIDATFVIAPININRTTIVMPNMSYTGAALMPKPVSITVNGLTLVEGVDYDIVGYGSNTAVGNAKVTLQGKGNFTGTVVADWKIAEQGSSQTGTTQTLPQTGDSTNIVAMVVVAVVGVALIAVAVALIVHRAKSSKGGRGNRR